ncbi:MAG: glycerophosphodiester phosphodiesterase [Infirmifilum sp.]
MMPSHTPVVVGHKANKKSLLLRFLELNLKIIEFDVREDRGNLVVRHGFHVGGTGVRSLIMSYGYLLIDGRDPIFKPSTLEEYLKIINGRAGVWLDVKSRGFEREAVERALSSGVKEVIVSTGFHNMLRRVKEGYSSITAMLGNVDYRPANPVKEVELAGADGLSINIEFVDKELVEEMRSVGYKVAVWVVNDIAKARWLAQLGVDYIITDIPEKIVKVFLQA